MEAQTVLRCCPGWSQRPGEQGCLSGECPACRPRPRLQTPTPPQKKPVRPWRAGPAACSWWSLSQQHGRRPGPRGRPFCTPKAVRTKSSQKGGGVDPRVGGRPGPGERARQQPRARGGGGGGLRPGARHRAGPEHGTGPRLASLGSGASARLGVSVTDGMWVACDPSAPYPPCPQPCSWGPSAHFVPRRARRGVGARSPWARGTATRPCAHRCTPGLGPVICWMELLPPSRGASGRAWQGGEPPPGPQHV